MELCIRDYLIILILYGTYSNFNKISLYHYRRGRGCGTEKYHILSQGEVSKKGHLYITRYLNSPLHFISV